LILSSAGQVQITLLPQRSMTIDEKDFLTFITIKESLDKNSVKLCRTRAHIINNALGDKQLTKQFVEEFFMSLKEKGLKNNSLNSYLFAFNHLVSYSKDRGLPYDFLDGFKSFKKEKPDIIILTLDEIEKIISTKLTYGKFRGRDTNFLDFRFRTMTRFLAYTGCRYSEAAELTVKHVDISAGSAQFVDTKTDNNRTVYFAEPLKSNLAFLIKNKKPNERVFTNSMEKLVQTTDFSNDLKRRAKAAGVTKRVHPHVFRHSWATQMLEEGVPETQVASLGGWKDIQTLYDTYMHLADKTLQRAAMRHPSVRKNLAPIETIKQLKEILDNLHLNEDPRFRFSLLEEGSMLKFELLAVE
jgi:site-specific recombinase XerD